VIKIAHFQSKRGDPTVAPTWPEAEKLLNQSTSKEKGILLRPIVLGVSAYPSALHHNLVIVYDDSQASYE
jgi:hypothetical protein